MKKKVTPKGFDEASRTTRVKMYKSGKQWVQCLLTRLGMIKLSSGVKPEEVKVETNLDSKTTSLLKGVLESVGARSRRRMPLPRSKRQRWILGWTIMPVRI